MKYGALTKSYNSLVMGPPEERAPEETVIRSFRLSYGKNKNLAITDGAKYVEAHSHNDGKRITLLY